MELVGRIDEHGQPWLPITVRGFRSEVSIAAILDTGFTWALLLPISIAVPLGLELVDFRPMELPDGSIKHLFAFAIRVVIGDREIPCVCLVTETDAPLIGTMLLQLLNATVTLRFAEKSVVLSIPNG